jgi:AcrR family transcriptional regulator
MPKKRVRLPADERREKIVVTAINLIATRGFFAISFQMIADECGISQSAVLYHFKNRDELYEAVLQQLVRHNHEEVSAMMRPEDGAADRLRKHFWGNIAWAMKYPSEGQTLLLLYYLASYDPHFSVVYASMLQKARARIREHLLAGMREGAFRRDIDPDRAAETLHDALLGSFINYLTVLRSGEPPADPRAKWEGLLSAYAG